MAAQDNTRAVVAAHRVMSARVCHVCRLPAPAGQKLKRCTRCRGSVRYCGVECQRVDWSKHQELCSAETSMVASPPPPLQRPPLVLSAELVDRIREAREFVADSLQGGRPWVVDLKDGKGLGALESQAKMQLLIEVLRTRHSYSFKELTVSIDGGKVTGRFHLFELRTEPSTGLNFLALAFGLSCSGPVVVELRAG